MAEGKKDDTRAFIGMHFFDELDDCSFILHLGFEDDHDLLLLLDFIIPNIKRIDCRQDVSTGNEPPFQKLQNNILGFGFGGRGDVA